MMKKRKIISVLEAVSAQTSLMTLVEHTVC